MKMVNIAAAAAARKTLSSVVRAIVHMSTGKFPSALMQTVAAKVNTTLEHNWPSIVPKFDHCIAV